ncbi:MAG: ABC transporter ATP-binding protein [Planctomycetota bacterium]|nr:ABC transporter ATP-binding protein [Planctomycetota bacterium]
MIELVGLTKRFGGVKALDGLRLAVGEGGLFAFLGPNGAGKTTTIRILNGLTRMDSGQARIAGIDIAADPATIKKMCGLASQSSNLDSELTVAENLDFHGRLYGLSRARRRAAAAELLDYVDMADRADSLVRGLSGGLKRRLMVARALLHRPRLLFLDEPTAGLDPAIRRRLWNLIKKICRDGVTVFLTTHYIEEAEFLADRVGFIDQGRLAAEGSPAEMMARMGQWAVDQYGASGLETRFFAERGEASACLLESGGEAALRRVNLEDVFLSLTGRRVR